MERGRAERETAPPPRGVIGRSPDARIEHQRALAAEPLRARVEHFWWVAWSLEAPLVAETLPHPSFHLTFEHQREAGRLVARPPELGGVPRGRFVRRLEGSGAVLGVKLRPAMMPWLPRAASAFVDRVEPLEALAWVPSALRSIARAPLVIGSLDEGVALLEPRLAEALEGIPLEDTAIELRDLVERAARDPSIVRVEQLASLARLDVRTLQRRFARFVGVSPKWVLRRYRLHEAAERLKASPEIGLAQLAAELGYADQAHFARDFAAVVGRTPSAFAREAAAARAEIR
ncbi:MAG: helix-turn-helix domain-containing protein [Sandaracinaceae bacterium]|nr:helix-turn-helix domain-containing protein [Sandaracinaceae bacterium]